MTHLTRLLAAFAVLALATPAIACEHDKAAKTVTASAEKEKAKKAKTATKPAAEQKPVTAQN